MRIRAQIDLATTPWFGKGLQQSTLNNLRNKISPQDMDVVVNGIRQVLNREDIVAKGIECQGDLGNFLKQALDLWLEVTQQYPLRGTLTYAGKALAINGVKLIDMTNIPIIDMSQPPTPLIMLSVWRAIVQGRFNTFPGLPYSISMAGLYAVLMKMGIEFD